MGPRSCLTSYDIMLLSLRIDLHLPAFQEPPQGGLSRSLTTEYRAEHKMLGLIAPLEEVHPKIPGRMEWVAANSFAMLDDPFSSRKTKQASTQPGQIRKSFGMLDGEFSSQDDRSGMVVGWVRGNPLEC